MMKKFGISYTSAGENIAQGQRTPEEVVQAWMNSAGHRANILNNGFTHIGVGYVRKRQLLDTTIYYEVNRLKSLLIMRRLFLSFIAFYYV